MADAKGTYNSPSAQGWATVLPSGPNFLGMATALENQKLRKQMAEQAAADKRLADREKGISDLLSDFKDPVTAPQKYQGMITDGYKSMMDKMQKDIAAGRPLGDIRAETSISYQKLKGEAKAGTDVIALITSIDEMNKGQDYQIYNTDKLKEHVANKLVGDDGKMLPPSTLRTEDLFPDKALYGQGSAGAQFLNSQAVVDNFAQSKAMKEIVVKMQENPTQSRANGMVNTLQSSYSQTSKPFQKLEIDKQGKVKVGIMEPEELIESGIYLAAINDKNMGLIIDAAADEFFANRPIPPTKQEREYEEARILGELLTGQVGGATYDRKMTLKSNNLPVGRAPGRTSTAGERQEANIWASSDDWWKALRSPDVNTRANAARFVDEAKLREIVPGIMKDETIMDIGMRPDGTMTFSTESKRWDAGASEYKYDTKTYTIDIDDRKEALKNAYSYSAKTYKRYYKEALPGAKQSTTNKPFSIFKK
jgi:hypothetical protein